MNSALVRQRKEASELDASLGYTVNLSPKPKPKPPPPPPSLPSNNKNRCHHQ